MRIAVLSDTHDHIPAGLPERLKSADEIWHLGDVCNPDTLLALERLGPTLRVVRGNCDAHTGWPPELNLELEGTALHLVHIPPPRPPPGVAVVLHGHTHVPRDELRYGVRWLNPGSVSRPRDSAAGFAWLTVEKGGRLHWKPVRL